MKRAGTPHPPPTPPLRDTKYARELATARLPSGPTGTSFVAIERIHVKQADQVEIRFSWWEGSRMMPRPLDLPEEELLPLLRVALEAGVFSDAFVRGLRALVHEHRSTPAVEGREPTDLERIEAGFHALIRLRAGRLIREDGPGLPSLSPEVGREDAPALYPVEGMQGGFKYWWDSAASGLRLITESWSGAVDGSGQLHEITPEGTRLLGEGFV